MTVFSFLPELFPLTQVKSDDVIINIINSFIYGSSNQVLESELFYFIKFIL